MRKTIAYIIIATQILMCVLNSCGSGKEVSETTAVSGATESETTSETGKPGGEDKVSIFKDDDFLITKGTDIVTKSGDIVRLRGLNIGGWLLHTIYMSPITGNGIKDDTDVYRVLDERFGVDGRNELFDAYYESFITADDLDEIAKTGANVIRVPFWWRNFMDENGEFIKGPDGKPDFSVLDDLVRECSYRGIYVIPALHGAPGSQNGIHMSGIASDEAKLFARTDEGERYRQLTVKLWKAIAEHFSGNPTIAGFDLLGEPHWTGVITATNYWWIWNVYDRLYEAIREVDRERIIIMETSWNTDVLPNPKSISTWKENVWENIAYSPHHYPMKTDTTKELVRKRFQTRIALDLAVTKAYQVPLYVGEVNCYVNSTEDWEIWDEVLTVYNENGVNYTPWAYKIPYSDTSIWGIMYRGTVQYADVTKMSLSTIKSIWSKTTKQSMKINEPGVRMLCRYFGGDIRDFGIRDKTGNEIDVISITLDDRSVTLKAGETFRLTATVAPDNATDKTVIWSSSNEAIASVADDGTITAKAAGKVYITAKSAYDWNITANCTVNVG